MRRMRMMLGVCSAIALAVLVPSRASAQRGHDAELGELRASIDSLFPSYRALSSRDSAWSDSLYRARYRLKRRALVIDSVTIGPFKMIGDHDVVDPSRGAATAAWKVMEPLFKGYGAPEGGILIPVNKYGLPKQIKDRITTMTPVVSIDNGAPELWEYNYERAMGMVLTRRLPASVQNWLNGDGISSSNVPIWTYRSLALPIPDSAHRESGPSLCIQGNSADCRRLLGLEPLNARSDGLLRTSFLTWVVKNGREGAASAYTSDTSSVIPALERIGGAPVDVLIDKWRADLVAQRPRHMAGTAGLSFSVLFWIIVCAAIASRSTRWRLG